MDYISMKKDIEIINKNQVEIKNTISEKKSTQEGIKIRLDEAEDQIIKLEDKVEKKHPVRTKKQNKNTKEEQR